MGTVDRVSGQVCICFVLILNYLAALGLVAAHKVFYLYYLFILGSTGSSLL